jgi:hypothetical protein
VYYVVLCIPPVAIDRLAPCSSPLPSQSPSPALPCLPILPFSACPAHPCCPPFHPQGLRLLSAGADRSFRVFSTIQDQQSRELSQKHTAARAKRSKVSQEELKLPRVTQLAACEVGGGWGLGAWG